MGHTWGSNQWAERIGHRKEMEKAASAEMGEWLERETNPTVFGTLTFRPPRGGNAWQVSDKSAMWAFKQFARRVRRCRPVGTRIAVTLEHHKDGRPHGHMVAHLEGLTDLDKAVLDKCWRQSHRLAGFTRWRKVSRGATAARYAAKYVGKTGGDFVLGREVR